MYCLATFMFYAPWTNLQKKYMWSVRLVTYMYTEWSLDASVSYFHPLMVFFALWSLTTMCHTCREHYRLSDQPGADHRRSSLDISIISRPAAGPTIMSRQERTLYWAWADTQHANVLSWKYASHWGDNLMVVAWNEKSQTPTSKPTSNYNW